VSVCDVEDLRQKSAGRPLLSLRERKFPGAGQHTERYEANIMVKIQASCPHFLVSNILAAGRYYEEKLGFTIPEYWGVPPVFAMPHRDGFVVMLNQAERLSPRPNGADEIWDAYFWCNGVDDLYKEFCAAGANIVHGPADREQYNMREIGVCDLDGYLLVFAEKIAGSGRAGQ
jgi:hypothetical protein